MGNLNWCLDAIGVGVHDTWRHQAGRLMPFRSMRAGRLTPLRLIDRRGTRVLKALFGEESRII
jgi:hypothetical protein